MSVHIGGSRTPMEGQDADFASNYSEQIERWCTDLSSTPARVSRRGTPPG